MIWSKVRILIHYLVAFIVVRVCQYVYLILLIFKDNCLIDEWIPADQIGAGSNVKEVLPQNLLDF